MHVEQTFPSGVRDVLDCLPPSGAAAVVGDVNGDHRDDLFVTSSALGSECALYIAQAEGIFVDATATAGLLGLNDTGGLVSGATFADVDADGDLDLYVVRWGTNLLFRNRGDGIFDRDRDASGADDTGNACAAIFFDADGDGDLDLYVANLLPDVSIREAERLDPPAVGANGSWNGGTNRFYRQEGGRFLDTTAHSGTGDTGWSCIAAAADIDGDSDLDILVGNAYGPLRLYRNQGGLHFQADDACFGGGSMSFGIDFGDVNGDSLADVLVSGLGHPRGVVERSRLWLCRPGEEPDDIGAAAGLGLPFRTAGGRFLDIDRDGDLDILFANGFDPRSARFEELAGAWVSLDSLAAGNSLVRFQQAEAARGRWCVAWNESGTFALDPRGGALAGPGCATCVLDVDADGSLDAYIAARAGAGALLVNTSPTEATADSNPSTNTPADRKPVAAADANTLCAYERYLRRHPLDFERAAAYRRLCVQPRLHDRAVRFFRDLRGPFPVSLALQRILVYVDGVQRHDEGPLVQGGWAAMGLVEAGRLIQAYPEVWWTYDLRALNHLYWPVEFRHVSRAIADFRHSLDLVENMQRRSPHHSRVFLGLGDAFAKGGDVDGAIATWKRGQALFPRDPVLSRRLSIPRERVTAVVGEERSLSNPPDTRIEWIEAELDAEPLLSEWLRAQAGDTVLLGSTGCSIGSRSETLASQPDANTAAALVAQAMREPENLVQHMLAYAAALERVEVLVLEASRAAGRIADPESVQLARAWLLLKGSLTAAHVEAASRALSTMSSAGSQIVPTDQARAMRRALLVRIGVGDAENLLGRVESGYVAWRPGGALMDDPIVSSRALIPIEHVVEEVWSWQFGHGVVAIETLDQLFR